MSRTDVRHRTFEQYRWEPNFDGPNGPLEDGRLVHEVHEVVEACSAGHRYTAESVRLRGRQKRLVCVTCERDRSRNHKRRIAAARKGA